MSKSLPFGGLSARDPVVAVFGVYAHPPRSWPFSSPSNRKPQASPAFLKDHLYQVERPLPSPGNGSLVVVFTFRQQHRTEAMVASLFSRAVRNFSISINYLRRASRGKILGKP
jgi:hypothetical protein